jgi:hypothetical protein
MRSSMVNQERLMLLLRCKNQPQLHIPMYEGDKSTNLRINDVHNYKDNNVLHLTFTTEHPCSSKMAVTYEIFSYQL